MMQGGDSLQTHLFKETIGYIFLDIYMCEKEEAPANSIFYKRYVDDTYVSGKIILITNYSSFSKFSPPIAYPP